jgi:peptide/nickel transport system ATP-binding protein
MNMTPTSPSKPSAAELPTQAMPDAGRATNATPLLSVRNLRVQLTTDRGEADALREISFTLARGETLGIVGESGSGKSTLALSLPGLMPEGARVSGSIALNGEELIGLPDRALQAVRGRRIGMVFQEPMTALNPLHRVGDQVAEPLRLHQRMGRRAARAEAIALLGRVGIPHAAAKIDAYPHAFSGGQRQRIGIAMALACGPDLLIADEPTSALDVSVQRQVLALLRELVAERGMALILISHDLGVVASAVGRVLVMYGGCVVEAGRTNEIFSRPAHPYTRGLLAARPVLGAPRGTRLATIAGQVPALADMPAGCPFAGRCDWTIDACQTALPPAVPALSAVPPRGEGHVARCIRLADLPPFALPSSLTHTPPDSTDPTVIHAR